MSNKEERPDAVATRVVYEILDEQTRLWSQGSPVLVEALLLRAPAVRSDYNVILDLIYNEIVLREKDGDFTCIRFEDQRINFKFRDRTFDRQAPLSLEQVRQAAAESAPAQ